MAGHAKWKQIKHYMAATDKKRNALFTKLIREITVAAKFGGGDHDANPRLRTAIDNAKSQSMPKENIERAVLKGTGELEGVNYQEVTYEGYGPGGVALLIDAVTDNPTRTVADVRSKMTKLNGNLGTPNSVAWMFAKKGQGYVDAAKDEADSRMEKAPDAVDLVAPGGLIVKDDLSLGWEGPDLVRELLFGHPRLLAVELLSTPVTAGVVAGRLAATAG